MLKSLLSSSAYSVAAAVVSYTIIIYLARIYSVETFSYYLYVMAWGLIIVQFIDFASEQCLVHFARKNSKTIENAWYTLALFKCLILTTFITILFFIKNFIFVDIPYECLLLVIPVIYMGPIYEYYGKNVLYAQFLLLEKIIFLSFIIIITILRLDIIFVIFSYFLVSIFSLALQRYGFPRNKIDKNDNLISDIKLYTMSYLPVYLILLSQLFYGNISRLIIEAKIGVIAFASITLALQIVNAISMVQSQVDRHMRPVVIQAVSAGAQVDLGMIAKQYLLYYLMPIAIGCVSMSVFSANIITVLFGPKWIEAGNALSLASPLIFTIACMRFIDILVVPLNAARVNLVVNVVSSAMLFVLLWLNPNDGLGSYVLLIVLCQATHVAFMSAYVYVQAKRQMALVAVTSRAPD